MMNPREITEMNNKLMKLVEESGFPPENVAAIFTTIGAKLASENGVPPEEVIRAVNLVYSLERKYGNRTKKSQETSELLKFFNSHEKG